MSRANGRVVVFIPSNQHARFKDEPMIVKVRTEKNIYSESQSRLIKAIISRMKKGSLFNS